MWGNAKQPERFAGNSPGRFWHAPTPHRYTVPDTYVSKER